MLVRLIETATRPPPEPLPQQATSSRTKTRLAPESRSFAPTALSATVPGQAPAIAPETGPDARNLVEQAKGQIDRESRRNMLDPMFAAPAPKTAPALSPLALALGVPVVGESRIRDRLYQYTTANGRRFCVTVPPDIDLASHDLLTGGRTLVPTNCPR